eukprot:1184422-Prorocentrum_minimum.AAC.2
MRNPRDACVGPLCLFSVREEARNDGSIGRRVSKLVTVTQEVAAGILNQVKTNNANVKHIFLSTDVNHNLGQGFLCALRNSTGLKMLTEFCELPPGGGGSMSHLRY